MTEAIFGLVGVIIGGLISAGVDLSARASERRQALRYAARVMGDEVLLARMIIDLARQDESVDPLALLPDLWSVWVEQREALSALKWNEWDRLRRASLKVRTMKDVPPTSWADDGPAVIRTSEDLKNAADVLVERVT